MSDKKIRKLVVSALMAALTYVATMVIQPFMGEGIWITMVAT